VLVHHLVSSLSLGDCSVPRLREDSSRNDSLFFTNFIHKFCRLQAIAQLVL